MTDYLNKETSRKTVNTEIRRNQKLNKKSWGDFQHYILMTHYHNWANGQHLAQKSNKARKYIEIRNHK